MPEYTLGGDPPLWYPDKNGHIYESIYDGKNSWSPDDYPQGWLLIE